MRTIRLAPAVALATATLLLAACTTPVGEPIAEEPVDQTGGGGADIPCVVGTWTLDVPDYEAQSQAFLAGQGVPVEGFAMTGAGKATFTDDGMLSADIDLTVNATLQAGDTTVPIEQRTAYTGTGDWVEGDEPGSIDLENWAAVPKEGVENSVEEDGLPTIDFFDIPTIVTTCTADTLVLQGPDAPLAATWHR